MPALNSPIVSSLQSGLRFLVVWVLLGALPGCLGVPQVETSLYQSPQGQIILKTFTNASGKASHPAIIELNLLQEAFRGLHVREDKELLDRMLRGEGQDLPVFTDQEAQFLALVMKDALTQATSEEYVWFQLTHQEEESSPSTSGGLYLSKDILWLGLDQFRTDRHSSSLSSKPSFSPTRIKNWFLVFSPTGADRTDSLSSEMVPFPARIGSLAITLNELAHPRERKGDEKKLAAPEPHIQNQDNDAPGIQGLQKEIEKLQKLLEGQNQKLQQLEKQLDDAKAPK